MKKTITILVFVIIIIAIAISVFTKKSQTKGYSKIENDVYIKHIVKSDSLITLNEGDYSRVSINYTDKNDSLFYSNICDIQIQNAAIKNHISSILRKLNANDRAHAVVLAIKHGWITVEENSAKAALR